MAGYWCSGPWAIHSSRLHIFHCTVSYRSCYFKHKFRTSGSRSAALLHLFALDFKSTHGAYALQAKGLRFMGKRLLAGEGCLSVREEHIFPSTHDIPLALSFLAILKDHSSAAKHLLCKQDVPDTLPGGAGPRICGLKADVIGDEVLLFPSRLTGTGS